MERESVAGLVGDLTERLASLAAEFSRRADELAKTPPAPVEAGEARRPRVAVARQLLEQRRARSRFLPAELFHEPAWDMLLALYIAQHSRQTMNVKTLVSHSEAPATTSQRWIDHLDKLGLIARVTDMADRRRIEVALSETGEAAVDRYLESLG